jgi:hypothetical protein
MRYHEVLVESTKDKRLGNHEVEVFSDRRYFFYHGHMVCSVNESEMTFKLDDCGYGSHPSTKNCLAGYRKLLTAKGYTEIDPKPIFNYEYKQNVKKD